MTPATLAEEARAFREMPDETYADLMNGSVTLSEALTPSCSTCHGCADPHNHPHAFDCHCATSAQNEMEMNR